MFCKNSLIFYEILFIIMGWTVEMELADPLTLGPTLVIMELYEIVNDVGRVHPHHHHQQQQQRRKPGEEDIINLCFFSRLSSESTEAKEEKSESAVCGSKAMVESVEEVCRDIAWGERREVGRLGLVLQDYICRDLIEETVAEMGYVSSMYSLPFEACKRKLCF